MHIRSIEGIKSWAKLLGWEIDSNKYDVSTGNYIWLSNPKYKGLQVLCNISCGLFFAFSPAQQKPIATNESHGFINVKWFCEIQNILYRQEVSYADP